MESLLDVNILAGELHNCLACIFLEAFFIYKTDDSGRNRSPNRNSPGTINVSSKMQGGSSNRLVFLRLHIESKKAENNQGR
jgi:hypothetical protein